MPFPLPSALRCRLSRSPPSQCPPTSSTIASACRAAPVTDHAAAPAAARSGSRYLKVSCPNPDCGYQVRITSRWLAMGTPQCPVRPRQHGLAGTSPMIFGLPLGWLSLCLPPTAVTPPSPDAIAERLQRAALPARRAVLLDAAQDATPQPRLPARLSGTGPQRRRPPLGAPRRQRPAPVRRSLPRRRQQSWGSYQLTTRLCRG